MKLYCIIRALDDPVMPVWTFSKIEKACKHRGVELVVLESNKIDYSNLPRLKKGDMLYRITDDKRSLNLQSHLINPEVSSFFITHKKQYPSAESWPSVILHRRAGLPIIPTIIDLPRERALIDKYVKSLDGYPIVIKVQGGSHGVGVIRADSSDSLYSILDYLKENTRLPVALRKYIDFKSHARLIVLGNKVIDSIEYIRPAGDFRSNAGSRPKVAPKKFPAKVEKAAVKAVRTIGYEFGGVDILIDNDGKSFYIAEVNFPCNFSRSQDTTGVDIAGAMVDYLMEKAKR